MPAAPTRVGRLRPLQGARRWQAWTDGLGLGLWGRGWRLRARVYACVYVCVGGVCACMSMCVRVYVCLCVCAYVCVRAREE